VIDAVALMETQVEVLFRLDAAGRLRHVNEPEQPAAPRFFLGRTRDGNVWRYRYDLPIELARELDRIVVNEPVATGLDSGPPASADRVIALLRMLAPVRDVWRGLAYAFPDNALTARPTPALAVAVTARNAALLQGNFTRLRASLDAIQPCLAVVEDGMAVSVCHAVRRSGRAAEAGLETLKAYRGKGYAVAATAAWAAAVHGMGLRPLYSTSWDNKASQSVARRLGLVQYGEDWHVT